MARAAIYFNPEAYNTAAPTLMGRHAAGEGFLRGLIRHGAPGALALWNYTDLAPDRFAAAARDLCGDSRPIRNIGQHDRPALAELGVVSLPTPVLAKHAWNRRHLGDAAYSLCGVTHTTVSQLDDLVALALAPVQPWDAVVVTSNAVRQSLEVMYAALGDHLRDRLGSTRLPLPRFPVIPLGVDCARFERRPEARRAWRERLGIDEDDVVALYVGRFNHVSKMNPVPMALALEAAAGASRRRVHWVLAGWADEKHDAVFKQSVMAQALSLQVHFVDGRPEATRRSIWSVADLFVSLSDNVQETFGLTPVEAMAAGLPSVISDWDGYKDTVRDGVDGFRVPVAMARAGLGRDLALSYAQGWSGYDGFVASAAQFTAADIPAAIEALGRLIESPDLRARMGAAAQARAKEVFDWRNIIPQYEALWAELDARRRAAPDSASRGREAADNPWRLDPFRMFASYPSGQLGRASRVCAAPGIDGPAAEALMRAPLVRMAPALLPHPDEVRAILDHLARTPETTVAALLEPFVPGRRPHLERGLVWMAKYGLLRLPPGEAPAAPPG